MEKDDKIVLEEGEEIIRKNISFVHCHSDTITISHDTVKSIREEIILGNNYKAITQYFGHIIIGHYTGFNFKGACFTDVKEFKILRKKISDDNEIKDYRIFIYQKRFL